MFNQISTQGRRSRGPELRCAQQAGSTPYCPPVRTLWRTGPNAGAVREGMGRYPPGGCRAAMRGPVQGTENIRPGPGKENDMEHMVQQVDLPELEDGLRQTDTPAKETGEGRDGGLWRRSLSVSGGRRGTRMTDCISSACKGGRFSCRSTHESVCGGEACPFCQCAAAAAEVRRRTSRRLNALPREQQLHIADKYYGGDMPWKGQGAHV